MVSPHPTSPALSAISSASSFVLLESDRSSTVSSNDSEDEIVYSVTEDSSFLSSSGSSAIEPASDDDFVVLTRPRTPNSVPITGLSTPNGDYPSDRANTSGLGSLTAHLENLSVDGPTLVSTGSARKRRKGKKSPKSPAVAGASTTKLKVVAQPSTEVAAASYPSPGPSPKQSLSSIPAATPSTAVVNATSKKSKKKKKKKATGLGARSVVDDASERFSEYGGSENGSSTIYDEAVGYITSFLSNPAARKDSACRLTLLQALIIELGLASSSLPASLTSAKAYLKTRAFLNIREYLAIRHQGPAAVQSIMHSSRSSLIKDIKKKGKVPRAIVKDSGLQVLLVQCYH
ncbi:hypothetical protein DXG03_007263 [Asterophora parasitica]|uniref:Uncharacterized protein n=1 Tax=Asterophora parasitica TaxID=117018 RepID=A0A9P7KEM2_9AGAR|nr:hypothetical protein DXG03_007263 [Asterophora parasitica]